jgi:hypothetical protein
LTKVRVVVGPVPVMVNCRDDVTKTVSSEGLAEEKICEPLIVIVLDEVITMVSSSSVTVDSCMQH